MVVKIRILLVLFAVLFLGLAVRLFYWQVVKGSELSRAARSQYDSSKITSAPRGNIIARDGSFWVVRTDAWRVIANANLLKNSPSSIADKLTPLLKDADFTRLTDLLSRKGSWIPLATKVDNDVKKNIEAMAIPGISFEPEEASFYPEASSAAQLMGFVGKDENGTDLGYFGLEGYYNLPLSGKPGFVGRQEDVRGVPILLDGGHEVTAVNGVDLVTSVDKRIQIFAEQRLSEGILKYGAVGGSVIVMDPFNGNVLAMAVSPSFDPAEYRKYNDSLFKNPLISDSFEPGSIFKVLIMAAGLDAGVVTPDAVCDICDGPLKVDKYQIETWDKKYRPGSTMTEVIVNSDNIGMAFVGQKLGADNLYDYLERFGIGRTTGIDLQGESSPKLRKKGTWNIVDLATASFGQGIAVTGTQMIRAVSVIANGGNLVTPKVVTEIRGDGWEEEVKIETPKRIISEKSAAEMSQMMVAAASSGESKWTNVKGFTVAGKTGTAQIPVAGHYDPTNTNHSYIGFAPVGKPKFIMLVTLQSPTSSPWASETAAPLWYLIAKDLFPYFGVQPDH